MPLTHLVLSPNQVRWCPSHIAVDDWACWRSLSGPGPMPLATNTRPRCFWAPGGAQPLWRKGEMRAELQPIKGKTHFGKTYHR